MAPGERPQHPCLTNPNPKSAIQPDLIVLHRTFQHRHLSKHTKNYPYDLETSEFTVHFFEFRGYGSPPSDVGTPGDIYIDMTSEAYALYAMVTPGSWKRWVGHCRTYSFISGKERFSLVGIDHPVLQGRMLWVTDRNVVWATLKTIQRDDRSDLWNLDARHFLTKLMEYELQESKTLSGTRERGAPDAEGEADCRSSKKSQVDKSVDVQSDNMSVHSRDAHSTTIITSESISGERMLEDKRRLLVENQKLKEELTEVFSKLEKADGNNTSFSQRIADLESVNTTLQDDIVRIQREKELLYEQEHQHEMSIVDTTCLRNDELHDLPDSVKNDLDAHIKNFLSAIKDKDDARRRAEQAENANADKDARIQTLLNEATDHQSARVCLQNEVSDMAKRIQELVSERDRARAEAETAKKSLADKEAKILSILKD